MWQDEDKPEKTRWVDVWDSFFKELPQAQVENFERELRECPAFQRRPVDSAEIIRAVRTMGADPKRPKYPMVGDLIQVIRRQRTEQIAEKHAGLKSCGLCHPAAPGHQYGKLPHKTLGMIEVLSPCVCELGIQVMWDWARDSKADTAEAKAALEDRAHRIKEWRLALPDSIYDENWIYNPRITAALSRECGRKAESKDELQRIIEAYLAETAELEEAV